MKRAVRWIGIGITAAAAATMLMADLVLAAPPLPTQGVPQSFELDFDLFVPRDMQCEAVAPDAIVRASRSITGVPHLTIRGIAETAEITCRLADGTTFTTDAHRRIDYDAGRVARATVGFRRGAREMTVVVRDGGSDLDRDPQVLIGGFRRMN